MSKPSPPDPVATANAQAAMNKETAIAEFGLNATTQNNPWGSVSYEESGTWSDGTPRFTQNTTLTPEQQAIFDQTQAAQSNLAGIANEQSSFLDQYMSEPFQFDNSDAEQWAYDLASPRLLDQQAKTEAQLRTVLANKGIREGSAAWNSEMQRLMQGNSDQLNQLALTGRGQAFSEALAQRNQPINEITALMSGSQVSNPATMSGPSPQAGVAGVDYAGLVNQNYQQELAASQGLWGGIGGLFGTALSGGLF